MEMSSGVSHYLIIFGAICESGKSNAVYAEESSYQ